MDYKSQVAKASGIIKRSGSRQTWSPIMEALGPAKAVIFLLPCR